MAISDAERERRRERIQQTKPWLKSTGARTVEGKRRTRMNAFKTGVHSRDPKLAAQARRVRQALEEAEQQSQVFLALARSGILTAREPEPEPHPQPSLAEALLLLRRLPLTSVMEESHG
ncbi:MAG: hypothetical protein ACAF41_12495 [Leptolyngbya sp. BL-A-14]